MWSEDETGGGNCNEYRPQCSVFNEMKEQCDGAKDIRWETPTKACVHSISDTSNCQDYDECVGEADETSCGAKKLCEWQDGGAYGGNEQGGSCQYIETPDREEGAPQCTSLESKKTCGPTGTNPTKHCMWIVSNTQVRHSTVHVAGPLEKSLKHGVRLSIVPRHTCASVDSARRAASSPYDVRVCVRTRNHCSLDLPVFAHPCNKNVASLRLV